MSISSDFLFSLLLCISVMFLYYGTTVLRMRGAPLSSMIYHMTIEICEY